MSCLIARDTDGLRRALQTSLFLALATAVATRGFAQDRPNPSAEKPALEARPSVVGRVVDAAGKPMAFVSMAITDKDAYIGPEVWPFLRKWTLTDRAGRFALPPVPPGDYQVMPVRGIEIIGKTTTPEQLPEEFRKYADQPGTHRLAKPLTETFLDRVVTVKAGAEPAALEIQAVPHVTFTVHFIDSAGKPAKARPEAYPIHGELKGQDWSGWFDAVPGKPDMMTGLLPRGLKDALIQNDFDNVWWTWAPGTPRVGRHARLKQVDGDRPAIVAQRFESNTLEIRLVSTTGELPEKPEVSVFYPRRGGGDGGRFPTRVRAGVYRLDQMVLPGRDCEVVVEADGFKTTSTKYFQFAEEGQTGTIEVTLTPGVRAMGWKPADAQPVVLTTPEGKPIPQPVADGGPHRAITGRAVDKDTGKPVGAGVVTFHVVQRAKEGDDESTEDLGERAARTHADGRFTVLVAEKLLADHTPNVQSSLIVTITHPRYVAYWDEVDLAELAKRGVSEAFPKFRTAQMVPARRITGRLVGPDGRPIKGVAIYKNYDTSILDPDFPKTDDDGRFATNVPVGVALKLEFRARNSARRYYDVAADKTDLGEIRIAPGVRVSGQVLDGRGAPVPFISVTTPAEPRSDTQPNFVQTTDKNGRFQTDQLPPGRYRPVVGDFFCTEDGTPTGYNSRLAPGVYIPFPFEIRDGQPAPELTLRPVEHVTFVVKMTTTRPKPKPPAASAEGQQLSEEEAKRAENEFNQQVASLNVKGTYQGAPWAARLSYLNLSNDVKTCTVRVPKGLLDARLDFGVEVERFRIRPGDPELFGAAFRIARVESDLPAIAVRRYRETTLKVNLRAPDGKVTVDPKLQAHYVREPAMREAGAVFDTPPLRAKVEGDSASFSVLPDEEIELKAGGFSATRSKLSEGETREVVLTAPR